MLLEFVLSSSFLFYVSLLSHVSCQGGSCKVYCWWRSFFVSCSVGYFHVTCQWGSCLVICQGGSCLLSYQSGFSPFFSFHGLSCLIFGQAGSGVVSFQEGSWLVYWCSFLVVMFRKFLGYVLSMCFLLCVSFLSHWSCQGGSCNVYCWKKNFFTSVLFGSFLYCVLYRGFLYIV